MVLLEPPQSLRLDSGPGRILKSRRSSLPSTLFAEPQIPQKLTSTPSAPTDLLADSLLQCRLASRSEKAGSCPLAAALQVACSPVSSRSRAELFNFSVVSLARRQGASCVPISGCGLPTASRTLES